MTEPYTSKIRRRVSYRRFKGLYDLLRTGTTAEEIIYRVHDLMEAYWGFGSRSLAATTRETIGFIVEEENSVACHPKSYTLRLSPGELDMVQRGLCQVESYSDGTILQELLNKRNSAGGLDGWAPDEVIPDDVHEQAVEQWVEAYRSIMELDPGVVRRKDQDGSGSIAE